MQTKSIFRTEYTVKKEKNICQVFTITREVGYAYRSVYSFAIVICNIRKR